MSLTTLKVYTYSGCDSCRRAVKWLRANGIAFDERPIRDFPPSRPELMMMVNAYKGDIRRLFNTSGKDYRERRIAEKLPHLNVGAALGELANNGNLVKRPFVIGPGVAMTGFDEKAWSVALLGR